MKKYLLLFLALSMSAPVLCNNDFINALAKVPLAVLGATNLLAGAFTIKNSYHNYHEAYEYHKIIKTRKILNRYKVAENKIQYFKNFRNEHTLKGIAWLGLSALCGLGFYYSCKKLIN